MLLYNTPNFFILYNFYSFLIIHYLSSLQLQTVYCATLYLLPPPSVLPSLVKSLPISILIIIFPHLLYKIKIFYGVLLNLFYHPPRLIILLSIYNYSLYIIQLILKFSIFSIYFLLSTISPYSCEFLLFLPCSFVCGFISKPHDLLVITFLISIFP